MDNIIKTSVESRRNALFSAYDIKDPGNLKTIDDYLLSRKIDDKNEMTGIFEDYNFIYFSMYYWNFTYTRSSQIY